MFVRPISHIAGKRNRAPLWQTAAGTLAKSYEGDAINIQLTAIDPDKADVVSYSVTNGALPPGVSLSSTTGKLTGTLGTIGALQVVYNFTVTATDGRLKSPRAFRIIGRQVVFALAVYKADQGATTLAAASGKSVAAITSAAAPTEFAPSLCGAVYGLASNGAQIFAAVTAETTPPTSSILVSDGDGYWRIAFTSVSSGTHLRSIATDGTTIIATGDAGYMISSQDGDVWTRLTSPAPSLNHDIIRWDGSRWWLSAGVSLYNSSDGATWTKTTFTSSIATTINDIGFDGKGTILAGLSSAVLTDLLVARSTDNGTTWTTPMMGTSQTIITAVQYQAASKSWFRCGGGIYKSTDGGITWSKITLTGWGSSAPKRLAPIADGRLAACNYNVTAVIDATGAVGAPNGTSPTGYADNAICFHAGTSSVYTGAGNAGASSTSVICRWSYNGSGLDTPVVELMANALSTNSSLIFWTGKEWFLPAHQLLTPNGYDWRTPKLVASTMSNGTNFASTNVNGVLYNSTTNLYTMGGGPTYFVTAPDLGGPYTELTAKTTGGSPAFNNVTNPRWKTDGTRLIIPCKVSTSSASGGGIIVGTFSGGFTATLLFVDPSSSTPAPAMSEAVWTGQKWIIYAWNWQRFYITSDFKSFTSYTAGTYAGYIAPTVTNGVFSSSDSIGGIASDGAGTVIMGTSKHRYLSTDHGSTWTIIADSDDVWVSYSPLKQTFICCGTNTAGSTNPPVLVINTQLRVAGR